MTDKPTDAEIVELMRDGNNCRYNDEADHVEFARAVLAKWGTPAPVGVGEVAERYRNAIASACEGWTMPDGLRKHLETALWSPPTPQPTQPQAGAVPLTPERVKEIVRGAGYDQCGIPDTERAAFINGLRHGEQAHGIKGGQHGEAKP